MKVIPPLTLASTGTFTRASTATYFDAAGVMQTAAVDVPRFGYDPKTLAPQGLMAEGSETNLWLRSQEFDNAAWSNIGTPTVTANTHTAPDGTLTADTIVDTSIVNFEGRSQAITVANDGVTRAVSLFVRKTSGGVAPTFGLNLLYQFGSLGVGHYARLNTDTGAFTGANSFVDDCGTFWRFGAYIVNNGKGNISLQASFYPATAAYGSFVDDASATGTAVVWGFMGSVGVKPGSYVSTTAATATRAADVFTGAYSNIPEPDTGETAWNPGTPYIVGNKAIRTTSHRVYERLIAGTTATAPENDPINWVDSGPTNRTAMLDLYRNTQSVRAAGFNFAVAPGQRVDALALMGLACDSATVSMWVNGALVYSHTELMNTRTVLNWYDYFFAPFTRKENLALFDLPPYANGVISVVLTGTGNVACGALCVGQATDLGGVEYSAERGSLNFSKVDRDAFGNATLVPRRDVPTTRQTTWLPKEQVNLAVQVLGSLAGVPAVWSGLDDQNADGYFDALLILGVRKEFTVNVAFPEDAKLSLNLEEI